MVEKTLPSIPGGKPIKTSKSLSNTLLVANVLATALVVAIHYRSPERADFFQEFFANGLARIAVPFFALVSGFFFFKNAENLSAYGHSVRKRLKTLLIPYLCATITIYVMVASRDIFIKKIQTSFSLEDVFSAVILRPEIQLWFLRDLIVLTVLSWLFMSLRSFALKVFMVTGLFVCWLANFQFMPRVGAFYLINIETLFFFHFGALLAQHGNLLEKVNAIPRRPLLIISLAWVLLNLTRAVIDPSFDLWYTEKYSHASLFLHKIGIPTGIVAMLGWCARINHTRLTALSGFTFFVFLFHMQPVSGVVYRLTTQFTEHPVRFYLTFPLALVITFSIAFVVSRVMPRVYALFTGDRAVKTKTHNDLCHS